MGVRGFSEVVLRRGKSRTRNLVLIVCIQFYVYNFVVASDRSG